MQAALAQARLALDNGHLPVGCVLASDADIIAKAHNCVRKHPTTGKPNQVAHAEFLTLDAAAAKLELMPTETREALTLYTTVEPCMMCLGMLMCWRIGSLCYSIESCMDGVVAFAQKWQEGRDNTIQPGNPKYLYRVPTLLPPTHTSESKALFAEYAAKFKNSTYRPWADALST